ncbi:MAG: glycosyltransferase [Bernardetiaceae bacterium]|nr:glycosyltransferase [Bernardetiaceae bacterium]
MSYFFFAIYLLYAAAVFALYRAWRAIPLIDKANNQKVALPKVSVVIAVRNELAHLPALLSDLARQQYADFEVIIINDDSDDGSAELLERYQKEATFPLYLLHLTAEERGLAPKKMALQKGIRTAQGELILTTDGDCRLGVNWIKTMASAYAHAPDSLLICGAVAYRNPDKTVFGDLQAIEFASLIGVGGATIQMRNPLMCNAANLGFTPTFFEAVEAYGGSLHIASGDDQSLLAKAKAIDARRIIFVKNSEAVVCTYPEKHWSGFYAQRKRWASKWSEGGLGWESFAAILVFLFHILHLLAIFGIILGFYESLPLFFAQILIKSCFEFIFLNQVLKITNKSLHLGKFVLLQIVYSFYVLFFALAAQSKTYIWKARLLR